MKQLFAALLIFSAVYVSAQGIEGRALEMPHKYKTPVEGTDYTPAKKRASGSRWVVFSDSENNTTTTTAGGTEELESLGFLEEFYVAEEQGDYLHLIKDEYISFNGSFSPRVEDYGWINKSRLLLWSHCLVTRQGGIDKKAMILNTLNTVKRALKSSDSKIIRFAKAKDLSAKTDKVSQLYQIFYIYKITETAVLLGKVSKIKDPAYIHEDLAGWVPIDRINFWDHRIAAEPNWDLPAVEERKQASRQALVLRDSSAAKKMQQGQKIANSLIFWNKDSYEKRNIGDWRRFPVLESRNGIMKIGLMGEIQTPAGDVLTAEENAMIQRKYNEIRASKRSINLVFAIDGTAGMQAYHQAVAEAILQTLATYKNHFVKNIIRVGVVVYRNTADGEKTIEVQKLTNPRAAAGFIRSIKAQSKASGRSGNAMLLGIKSALRQMGWSKYAADETNALIVIGATGNQQSDASSKVDNNQIISMLSEKNCNTFSYQVERINFPAYDNFISQLKEIMLGAARKRFNIYKKSPVSSGLQLQEPIFVSRSKNTYTINNIALMGQLKHASVANPMQTADLKRKISSIFIFMNAYTNFLIDVMDRIVMSGQGIKSALETRPSSEVSAQAHESSSNFVNAYTSAVVNYLSQLGIQRDKLTIICKENYQFYMPGYATTQIAGMKYPLFKRVLFMTRKEFSDLLAKFDALARARTASQQRAKMKEVWLELLKEHVGGKPEDLLELTMEQVNEKVFGLPGTSNLLAQVKLKNLIDRSVVSDAKFQMYVRQTEVKERQLKKIFCQDNYEFSFRSNDETYYWLAEDLLP